MNIRDYASHSRGGTDWTEDFRLAISNLRAHSGVRNVAVPSCALYGTDRSIRLMPRRGHVGRAALPEEKYYWDKDPLPANESPPACGMWRSPAKPL